MRFRYFNPPSREGSDDGVLSLTNHTIHFNPRFREGSDLPDEEYDDFSDKISIHAPMKGATFHMRGLPSRLRFQSTLP